MYIFFSFIEQLPGAVKTLCVIFTLVSSKFYYFQEARLHNILFRNRKEFGAIIFSEKTM